MADSNASRWLPFGVQISTISISGFSVISRKSVTAFSAPTWARPFSAVASRDVQTWVICDLNSV